MSDTFTREKLFVDARQAAELVQALDRNGYTNADIKKMSGGELLAKLLPVLRGHAEVTMIKHIIDLDADPFVPDDWEVVEHHRMGEFEWDPKRIHLYLSPKQKGKKFCNGNELREELRDKTPLNANFGDYLLKYPHLIPEEWKGKLIFLWGTIYRDSDGRLYVRYLVWNGSWWYWNYDWFDDDFDSDGPAACLASISP